MSSVDLERIEKAAERITLHPRDGLDPSVHVLDTPSRDALRAAIASRRPLLVRGEPGTGKSQLARAAAEILERPFVWKVVDARTEAQDLQWSFDAVSRLADAQILGATETDRELVREKLAISNYLTPGPLWWAFHWDDALGRAEKLGAMPPDAPPGWQPGRGAVVLIDEIDKADSSVPNGLLECLGHGRFQPPGGSTVQQVGGRPLVVITTNEERALPGAFLRRCLVLHLDWETDEQGRLLVDRFKKALVERGAAHFDQVDKTVLLEAADQVLAIRQEIERRELTPPGGAEYLDLLRALHEIAPGDLDGQKEQLSRLADYALKKHPRRERL